MGNIISLLGWLGNVAKQQQKGQQFGMTPPMQQRMMWWRDRLPSQSSQPFFFLLLSYWSICPICVIFLNNSKVYFYLLVVMVYRMLNKPPAINWFSVFTKFGMPIKAKETLFDSMVLVKKCIPIMSLISEVWRVLKRWWRQKAYHEDNSSIVCCLFLQECYAFIILFTTILCVNESKCITLER